VSVLHCQCWCFTAQLRYYTAAGATAAAAAGHVWQLGDKCQVVLTLRDQHGNQTPAKVVKEKLQLRCTPTAASHAVCLAAPSGRDAWKPTYSDTADKRVSVLTWDNWHIVLSDTTVQLDLATPLTVKLALSLSGVAVLDAVPGTDGSKAVEVTVKLRPGRACSLELVQPNPFSTAVQLQNMQLISGLQVRVRDAYEQLTAFTAGTKVACLVDAAVAASTTVARSGSTTVTFGNFDLKAAAGAHTCKVTAGQLTSPQLQFTTSANTQAAGIRLSLTAAGAAQHGTAAAAAAAIPLVTQEVSTEAAVYMSVYSRDGTLLPIQPDHAFIALTVANSTEKLYYSDVAAKQTELCSTGKLVLTLPAAACERVVTVHYYRSAEQYAQDRANSSVDSAMFTGQFRYKATLPPLHHLCIEPVHTAAAAAAAAAADAVDDDTAADNSAAAVLVCGATIVTSIVAVVGRSQQDVVVPVSSGRGSAAAAANTVAGVLSIEACTDAATAAAAANRFVTTHPLLLHSVISVCQW
jgi:hypothetical protein